jgi:hypothetical protein
VKGAYAWAKQEIENRRAKFHEDGRAATFDVWLADTQQRNALKETLPSLAVDRGAAVRTIATAIRAGFSTSTSATLLPSAADLAELSAAELDRRVVAAFEDATQRGRLIDAMEAAAPGSEREAAREKLSKAATHEQHAVASLVDVMGVLERRVEAGDRAAEGVLRRAERALDACVTQMRPIRQAAADYAELSQRIEDIDSTLAAIRDGVRDEGIYRASLREIHARRDAGDTGRGEINTDGSLRWVVNDSPDGRA